MKETPFSIELGKLIHSKDVAVPWLSRKSSVPKGTIHKWLTLGRIPRFWPPIVKVGQALVLTRAEMDALLATANKPSISELKQETQAKLDKCKNEQKRTQLLNDMELLEFWPSSFFMPPAPDVIVGRDETIAQAISILTRTIPLGSREKRICMVQGMAGVGKTTIVKQIAHVAQTHFVDGVLWADLQEDTPDRLMSVLMQFGHACGLDLPKNLSLDALSQRVQSGLRGKQVLLILDDVQTGSQIDHIWPGGDEGALLLTARSLNLTTPFGTERIQLMPFSAKTDATLQLFREYLGEQRVKRERDAFAEIADLIHHLPLAATIVARRLEIDPNWSAAEFLDEELRPEHNRLTALQHDNLSVRLSFNLSYQNLPPPRQRQFAELGVFEGQPFSVEAAAHILDLPSRTTKKILRDLTHRALIERAQDDKFQLHLLLSQYAHDYLSGKESYARKVRYYVDYAHKNRYDDRALFSEIDNIRLSLRHAHEQKIEHEFSQGIAATYRFLFDHGLYETVSTYLDDALTIAQKYAQPDLSAQLFIGMGHVAARRGERKKAQQFVDKAKPLATEQTQIRLGRLQGEIAFSANMQQAIELFMDALALARKYDQTEEVIVLCYNLAFIYVQIGDLGAADPFIDESLHLVQTTDDTRLHSLILSLRGIMMKRRGKYEQAESAYHHALRLAHKVNNPREITLMYMRLAYLSRVRGQYDVAFDYCEIALVKADNWLEHGIRVFLLSDMAAVFTEQNKYKEARLVVKEGIALAQAHDHLRGRIDHLHQLGIIEMRQNKDWAQAKMHLEESFAIAEEHGTVEQKVHGAIALGDVCLKLDKVDTAATYFTTALNQAIESQCAAETELSRYGLARVAYMQSEQESAIEMATQSHIRLKEMGHFQAKGIEVWLRQIRSE